jgi:hypothetical protein
MKRLALLIAAFMGSFALHARADGFFVGARASASEYPNWVTTIDSHYYAAGADYSASSQKDTSLGYGIRAGLWVSDHFGFEAGYQDLGSTKGTTTVVFGPIAGTGDWEFSATARYAAVLGGIRIGRGTLFGKVGIQHSATTLKGTYVSGPRAASSSGALFGAGYSFPFTKHLAARAELEDFRNVRFVDYTDNYRTTSANLRTVSVGVDYSF